MRNYNEEYKNFSDQQKYAFNFDKILRNYMMQTFRPLLPAGRALELGCFEGDFTENLVQEYADVTVVEASDELVAFTQKRVGEHVKFITSVFETVELEGTYDAIFLMHTLEHLDDPVFVLQRINRWLSDKGRLFLVVPNANAPSRQIAVKMGLISHNAAVTEAEAAHGHRKTYSFDTLEKEAVDAGLQVVQRGGVFFKALANFQLDRMIREDIIGQEYLDGCYKLGMQYPDLCASIYLICEKGHE